MKCLRNISKISSILPDVKVCLCCRSVFKISDFSGFVSYAKWKPASGKMLALSEVLICMKNKC